MTLIELVVLLSRTKLCLHSELIRSIVNYAHIGWKNATFNQTLSDVIDNRFANSTTSNASFSPNGRFMAVDVRPKDADSLYNVFFENGSINKTLNDECGVVVIDLSSNKVHPMFDLQKTCEIGCLQWAPDNNTLAWCNGQTIIITQRQSDHMWLFKSIQQLPLMYIASKHTTLAFNNNSTMVAYLNQTTLTILALLPQTGSGSYSKHKVLKTLDVESKLNDIDWSIRSYLQCNKELHFTSHDKRLILTVQIEKSYRHPERFKTFIWEV